MSSSKKQQSDEYRYTYKNSSALKSEKNAYSLPAPFALVSQPTPAQARAMMREEQQKYQREQRLAASQVRQQQQYKREWNTANSNRQPPQSDDGGYCSSR
jgi:heme exporter protein D